MKALIVGGSGGIGSVVAVEYAKAGYDVVVTYYENQAKADEVAAAIIKGGGSASVAQVDVTSESSVEQLFTGLDELDCMIFSVADEKVLGVDEATYGDWRQVTAPMIDGFFMCMHFSIPLLKKSDNPNILSIPSTAGIKPGGDYMAYQTSHAAMIAMTTGNARYLGRKYKIRVNAVCSGTVRTPLWDKTGDNTNEQWDAFAEENPLGRVPEAIDVARACLSLTEDPGKYLNGNFLHVNGEGGT